MEEGDLEVVRNLRNRPEIRRFMYTRHEIGRAEHREWFARAGADPATRLLVFELDAAVAGFVKIARLTPASPVADWGLYLAPEAPRGTGAGLAHAALRYAFDDLGLHKVCAQVLAFNEKSIRLHGRLGFSEEGVLREQHFDGAVYHNVICFGLLRAEWTRATGGF
jgi:UDP-4-amino-4,6-dideoxy-N-acetyl-beta-L-altrosamine N-acetyltransferase